MHQQGRGRTGSTTPGQFLRRARARPCSDGIAAGIGAGGKGREASHASERLPALPSPAGPYVGGEHHQPPSSRPARRRLCPGGCAARPPRRLHPGAETPAKTVASPNSAALPGHSQGLASKNAKNLFEINGVSEDAISSAADAMSAWRAIPPRDAS
jgi:hypothetical protein